MGVLERHKPVPSSGRPGLCKATFEQPQQNFFRCCTYNYKCATSTKKTTAPIVLDTSMQASKEKPSSVISCSPEIAKFGKHASLLQDPTEHSKQQKVRSDSTLVFRGGMLQSMLDVKLPPVCDVSIVSPSLLLTWIDGHCCCSHFKAVMTVMTVFELDAGVLINGRTVGRACFTSDASFRTRTAPLCSWNSHPASLLSSKPWRQATLQDIHDVTRICRSVRLLLYQTRFFALARWTCGWV